jgi:hypothetical protein
MDSYLHTYTVTCPPQPPHRGAHKEKYTDSLHVLQGRLPSCRIVLYPRSFGPCVIFFSPFTSTL